MKTNDALKDISIDELLILIAVLQLKEKAYGVQIKKAILERTGKQCHIGSIYRALDRLNTKGIVSFKLSDKVSRQGGRQKKIFNLTEEGLETLTSIKTMMEAMWKDIN